MKIGELQFLLGMKYCSEPAILSVDECVFSALEAGAQQAFSGRETGDVFCQISPQQYELPEAIMLYNEEEAYFAAPLYLSIGGRQTELIIVSNQNDLTRNEINGYVASYGKTFFFATKFPDYLAGEGGISLVHSSYADVGYLLEQTPFDVVLWLADSIANNLNEVLSSKGPRFIERNAEAAKAAGIMTVGSALVHYNALAMKYSNFAD